MRCAKVVRCYFRFILNLIMKTMKLFSIKSVKSMLGASLTMSLFFALALVAVFPSGASAAALYRQLQLGMSGGDVSDLQTFLATDPTIYPQGLVTGYFGSLTKSAVSNFQARNGIATVGRVGPQTLAVINAQMGGGVTVGTDRQVPLISTIAISTSASSATLAWNTNENTSALLYYSTSPISFLEGSEISGVTIGGTPAIANIDLRATHSVTLSGLQSNTVYYYVVYVKDASGNESVVWPSMFKTN